MSQSLQDLAVLHPEGWDAMLALGELRTLAPQTVVFADREPGWHLFVVKAGLIEILKETAPGIELRLAILEAGAVFGEGALFEDSLRSATARSFKEVELIEIPVTALREYLSSNPAFALDFYRLLCGRLHRIMADLDADLKTLHRRLTNA
ncbi:cyclic nucleotide-binding domain-containing protein [bacterium]|nr:cyclic nucleotide-binding domain-containing protein [bacterium]